jgi:hypothetical protein
MEPIDFFYSDGTITLTNSSDIATGTFTAWDPAVLPYDILFANDGQGGASVVAEVISTTEMRLAKAWSGPTLTGVPYFILRWIKHTDPRIYGVRVSDYLTRLKAIPDNLEETATQVSQDRQAVDASLVTLQQVKAEVDADRLAVAADKQDIQQISLSVSNDAAAAAASAAEAASYAPLAAQDDLGFLTDAPTDQDDYGMVS